MERKELVSRLATSLVMSIFDGTGKTTDSLIDRINSDDHIPQSLKAEVYTVSVEYINKILIELAKQLPPDGRGEIQNVGSKDILEEIES